MMKEFEDAIIVSPLGGIPCTLDQLRNKTLANKKSLAATFNISNFGKLGSNRGNILNLM